MIRPCPKKWYGGKRQANTGSAGALARYEREVRNSYGVKKFEIERAAHAPAGEGARAPSTNRLVPYRIDFLGKASLTSFSCRSRYWYSSFVPLAAFSSWFPRLIRSHPQPHAGCPRGDPGPLAVLTHWPSCDWKERELCSSTEVRTNGS